MYLFALHPPRQWVRLKMRGAESECSCPLLHLEPLQVLRYQALLVPHQEGLLKPVTMQVCLSNVRSFCALIFFRWHHFVCSWDATFSAIPPPRMPTRKVLNDHSVRQVKRYITVQRFVSRERVHHYGVSSRNDSTVIFIVNIVGDHATWTMYRN